MTCQRCNHSDTHSPQCTGTTRKGNRCGCPKLVAPPKTRDSAKTLQLAGFYGSLPREIQNGLLAAKFGITPEEANKLLEDAVDRIMEKTRKWASETKTELDAKTK